MSRKRQKTISYHRAEYYNTSPESIRLSSCIRDAVEKSPTIAHRTISRGDGQYIKLASIRSDEDGGHYLHLTVDTPGEAASIVPKVAPSAKEITVGTTAPPDDAEFMDGDAFLYVRGNDLCLCTTTIRSGAVEHFLHRFFLASSIRKDAVQFGLMNAANVEKIALLQKKGVSHIELKASLYRASVDYNHRRNQVSGVVGEVSRYIKSIVASEHDVNEDALRVEVAIFLDKRTKGIPLGQRRLEKMAIDIIENETDHDEYVIITKDKERIEPDQIFMRSSVIIEGMGKSVDRDEAWAELLKYYNTLLDSGALGQ